MLFTSLFALIVTKSAFSLQDNFLHFSLDFFQIRDVRFICLLTCGDKYWDQKFAKHAANSSTALSNIRIDDLDDFEKVNQCLNEKMTTIGVFIETSCELFEDILLFASENAFFDGNHKWLVVDTDSEANVTGMTNDVEMNKNLRQLTVTFDKLNLSVDADITLSLQKGVKNYIYEVYNFGKIRGGTVIVNQLGSWDNKPDLVAKLNGYKYYRRWDFNQSTLNLVAVMSTPPKTFDVDMIIGNRPKPGVAIVTVTSLRVFEELRKLHNIRYNYTILDRWIGDFQKNSSRVVANSIYFREQEVTPLLRVTPETFQKLDMLLPPLTSIETRYYYRIPTTGPGKLENQFLRPLTEGAWGCVTAVIALCALMLFVAAKVERRPSAVQYAVFSVLATLCQQFFQDNDNPRRESSARQLAVLVTGTSCVLIYNYYTSSVVSWLLNGPPPSINSLDELLKSPLSLIFQDIGYTRSWLQNPTYYYNKKNAEVEDKLRRYKVFNKRKGDPLLVPLEEGIEMVKAGGILIMHLPNHLLPSVKVQNGKIYCFVGCYAYHTEVYNANTLISRTFTQEQLCELGSLQSMEKTRLYAVIPKNSPYKEFFNWNLLRLHETGIISRIQRRSSNPEIACEGSSPRALALGGAAPAFLLLALGFLLATLILLMERFIMRRNMQLSRS